MKLGNKYKKYDQKKYTTVQKKYKQCCSVENTNEQVVGSHRSLATNTKMIRRNTQLFRRNTNNVAVHNDTVVN